MPARFAKKIAGRKEIDDRRGDDRPVDGGQMHPADSSCAAAAALYMILS